MSGDLGAAPLVPLVSRQRELAWLGEHWQATLAGAARMVLLIGEPGIGKSRLAVEFSTSLSASGYQVFTLVCRRRSVLTPLQPFRALLGGIPEDPALALARLQAWGEAGPTLLVVEDAHWADPSTVEVLRRASRLTVPLLLLVTARSEPLPDVQIGAPVAESLQLERLSPPDARRMVELFLDADRRDVWADEFVGRADGIPLYLEQLARHASAHTSLDAPVIPRTLMEVIAARLESLGDSARVAEMAAVVGREFDLETVATLCGFGEEELHEHLRRLAEAAVIEPRPAGGDTMSFRHSLIREAAHAMLSRSDQRRAHSAVADILLGAGRAEGEPQVAAYHLTFAERFGEAVAMWRSAARAARRYSRFEEAAGHERRILALLPYLERDHRDSVELKARSRLAMCLTAVDQAAPEILSEALRSQELARAYRDERTLLDTYLVLLPYWQARAEYRSIEAALPEIRELTGRAPDPGYRHSLYMVEACVRIWQGRLPEGLRQLGEMFEQGGIPLRDSLRTLPPLNAPTVLMRSSSRVAAALGLWLTGDARSAWRLVDDTLRFASERSVPAAHAVASATAALIAQLEGDRPRAAELAVQAEQAPEETATLQWRRWGAALHGWAQGSVAEADIPGPMLRPYFLMLAAEGPVGSDQALRMLDEAVETARATGETFCEAELLRVRGRIRQQAGQRVRAQADFRQAVGTARSQMARALELKALTDLVALEGAGPARSRLEELFSSSRIDGPALAVRDAARVLGLR